MHTTIGRCAHVAHVAALALVACTLGGGSGGGSASDGAATSEGASSEGAASGPGGPGGGGPGGGTSASTDGGGGGGGGGGTGTGEPPPPGSLYFTDVTESAGLAVPQGEFKMPPECLVDVIPLMKKGFFCTAEWETGGAAAADYDGDGRVDLYVARLHGKDALFHNQGDGTFVDRAAEAGLALDLHSAGAAWADIDNDGDLDLYVTTVGDVRHYLFINDGAGHFSEEAIGRGASLIGPDQHVGTTPAFGDFDLDGYVDLFVGEYRTHLALGDTPSYNRLLRNRGAEGPGTFEDLTEKAGVVIDDVWETIVQPYPIAGALALTPAFVDLDGDDYPELAIAADFMTSRLFWNQGDASFVDGTALAGVGTDENGMGASFGDFDGDGDLDWLVTSIAGTSGKTGNHLYRYDGDRHFTEATDLAGVRDGFWGWGASWADLDNDRDLDLVMTNGWNATDYLFDPMRLWIADGEGPMIESSAALGITDDRMGRGLLTFDYDDDGDLDVFVVNFASTPVLYRNDGELGNGWLRVRAVGTKSDSSGRGAQIRVRVSEDGPELLRVIGEPTYLGHGDLRAHFGLGPGDAPIAEVRVRWPASGAEVVLNDVARDADLTVVEP
ncbi:MAG: CRTAC1 family protein [Myxococcales bacterium]|nr:CRTAC1 family protein [Myxococcales bacterium]